MKDEVREGKGRQLMVDATQLHVGANAGTEPEPEAEPETGAERPRRRRRLGLLVAKEKREATTTALAAQLLGISKDTLYRWLNEGRLSGRKVGGRWIVYRDSVEEEWGSGVVESRQKPKRN